MKTPIAFFIYNRPEETKRVFEAIRRAAPEKLLIIADGPRTDADRSKCQKVRNIVAAIDWPCDVIYNFSEKNLGCKNRISSGLDWVFSQVERAIILEDDCFPDPSFFPFCEELLEKYKDDEKVMHISGTSIQASNPSFDSRYSYYASLIPDIWGWATWRRAWKHYDVNIRQWPLLEASGFMKKRFGDAVAYERFRRVWGYYYEQKIDSWDGQWTFACIASGGLCLISSSNAVTNIGAVGNGTHGKGEDGNLPIVPIRFPLAHPPVLEINRPADRFIFKNGFRIKYGIKVRLSIFISHSPFLSMLLKKMKAVRADGLPKDQDH